MYVTYDSTTRGSILNDITCIANIYIYSYSIMVFYNSDM